jgi:two-component system, NarL family, sensor histidine kinase DesK
VLAVVLALAFGGDWLELFIYVGCAAALTLPLPAALWAVGGVALVAGVVSQVVDSGWVGTLVAVLPSGGLGLGMIGTLHLFASIRELHVARRTAARLAVAEERLRIARDLHDLLGRSLSLIALKTELAGRLAASDPSAASGEIRDAERLAREALREVREAVAGYRQPMLRTELEDARDMLETAGIVCTITYTAGMLPPITDAVLAWAVREGATNVIRHSRAKRCTIVIVRDGDAVRCEIRDDGRGARDGACASSTTRGGSGLAGLAERVATGGGCLEAGPSHENGGGFCVRIELPAGGERVIAHTILAGGTGMGSETHDSRVAG